jgi:hypothetical protein
MERRTPRRRARRAGIALAAAAFVALAHVLAQAVGGDHAGVAAGRGLERGQLVEDGVGG